MVLFEEFVSPVLLVLVGLVLAFIGKKLMKAMVMLGGGAAFAYLVYSYSGEFGLEGTAVYVAVLLAFIVGAFLAWFLVKLVLALAIGFAVGMALTSILGLTGNLPALALLIIFSILIAYMLAEKLSSVAMTLLGIALFYLGLSSILDSYIGGSMATALSVIVSLILFILAAMYHLRKK